MRINRRFLAAVVLGLGTFGASRSEATFITYTETITGSGTLNGAAYTNALITITGTADTTSVTGSGVYIVPTSTTVSITGFATATFTDSIQAVDNQPNTLAGFGDRSTNFFVLGNHNAAFATYDLKSSIGPLSGSAVFNPGASFGTTAGSFVISSVSTDGTFTARLGTVPEPSSFVLCGIAGLLCAGYSRSRRMAA